MDDLSGIWVKVEILGNDMAPDENGHRYGTVAVSSSPQLGDLGVIELLRSVIEIFERDNPTVDGEYRL